MKKLVGLVAISTSLISATVYATSPAYSCVVQQASGRALSAAADVRVGSKIDFPAGFLDETDSYYKGKNIFKTGEDIQIRINKITGAFDFMSYGQNGALTSGLGYAPPAGRMATGVCEAK